ncbi:hypothetical protein HID58_096011 [Brassica napus]|uniref:GATA-type domain-containing protein n=1 Tax=Brassica napus TaxID=3708 RepID=A0ABQ7X1Q8_BRANA|nr:hypothetical protein HID58_096011 [Brassica napus]
MLDHTEKVSDLIISSWFTLMQLKKSAAAVMEEEVRSTRRRVAPFAVLAKPLFGGGPTGPKSLCNACGIRNKKKKSTVRSEVKKKKKKQSSKIGDSLKQRLMELGREVMMQRKKKLARRASCCVTHGSFVCFFCLCLNVSLDLIDLSLNN